jgi:hypothetical protein
LSGLILHRIGDFAEATQGDIAGLAIDIRTNVMLIAVLRPSCLLDSLFHGFQNLVPIDALLAGDRVSDLQQFHSKHPDLWSCVPAL